MTFQTTRLVFLFWLLVKTAVTNAQQFNYFQIPVTQNGKTLPLPWVGGLNAPQFSEVDLNGDGKQDLFVFDRVGNIRLTFLNNGTPGRTDYVFAPQFLKNFPVMTDWVLLRDFNGDGVQDIFCFSNILGVPGVEVHKGFMQNGEIHFSKIKFPGFLYDILNVPTLSGHRTQLYVSYIDIPAVDDIDGDRDLDILTFDQDGGFVEYYRNLSVEEGYRLDTLIFQLEEDCWGGFYESGVSAWLDLSPVKGECVKRLKSGGLPSDARHTGSTLLTWDLDNDCDKELLLGDLSFDHMVLAINSGSCDRAWVNSQDTFFPGYDFSVDLPSFPAGFFLDVNNDGAKDFIAAKNRAFSGEDYDCAWFYQNEGTTTAPEFSFQKKNFLVENMLDFGSGANPAFADVDADGRIDLVVGNESFYKRGAGDKDSRLFLFKNTGAAATPKFELADDNWLNFRQFTPAAGIFPGTWAFVPTFGDLDNDGDEDLLVGTEDGSLFFAENAAGAGNPMAFPTIVSNYKQIDIGRFSAPAIGDVNRDGLPDLAVGEEGPRLNYFQNTGTRTNPDFQKDETQLPNTLFFGQVNLQEYPGSPTGAGSPVLLDFGQKMWMLTGKDFGDVRLYGDVENNATGKFTLMNSNFGATKNGEWTRLDVADLDGDGRFEMAVGNLRGGLSVYKTNLSTTGQLVAVAEKEIPNAFSVFPNPTSGRVFIKNLPLKGLKINVLDVDGRRVVSSETTTSEAEIDLSDLPKGVYFLQVFNQEIRAVERVLKF